jgi:organic hydroperoxide reductase OsmC/OhrA
MSSHEATIQWYRNEDAFTDSHYSRAHTWSFDGGAVVPASPSPDIVPLPHSVAENVDPEEAFVASLSSCHMLVFLSIAAKRGYTVDSYRDEASGVLEKNDDGRLAVTRVTLRPDATYSGDKTPSSEQIEKMHHRSHELCFIANSVLTRIQTDIIA